MIRRTFDAARVNFLINHPSNQVQGIDAGSTLDMTPVVADHQNVFLDGEHGGFAGIWSAPRTYEVHTFILPEGRGAWAAEFAGLARDWMADHFADHLWTRVHPDSAHVRRFTLRAGFKPAGRHCPPLQTGEPVTYDIFDWRPECPHL